MLIPERKKMQFSKILCPVDFSDATSSVNEYASILAKSTGASITYLFVSVPEVAMSTFGVSVPAEDHANSMQYLLEVVPTIPDIESEHVLLFGTPASEIIDYANGNEIDLIVMGTHGRTGLTRLLMGSVAEAVVRSSECPVLTLKDAVPQIQSK